MAVASTSFWPAELRPGDAQQSKKKFRQALGGAAIYHPEERLSEGAFGEFETNLRRERQLEGIAKAAGIYKGRQA
jgi:hypothetical protein